MIREQLNEALKAAIKARDKRRTNTLRLIKAAVQDRANAIERDSDEPLSEQEIIELLQKMIEQRREAIHAYEEAGRLELAAQEQEEIDIIEPFLPRQLDEAQTRTLCRDVVKEIGAAGLKDVGRTMGTLKRRYPGQMDFSKASKFVKEMLK